MPSREAAARDEETAAPTPISWSEAQFAVEPMEGAVRFHDMGLFPEIMHAVADLGFRYCTPIQAQVLPHTRAGMNVAGRAQTGTGKTAAFLISIFSKFLASPLTAHHPGYPRALVLAPTRELVVQIVKDARELGRYCRCRTVGVYGGMDYKQQEAELKHGHVDIIVATPGRLLDFCRRNVVNLHRVEILVIDEADRMLDMGFIPDVRTIVRMTPPKEKRQAMLFSATLSDDVMRLASSWMPDPVKVEIDPEEMTVDTIDQVVYAVRAEEKMPLLYNLLMTRQMDRVLVFGNRRDRMQRIYDILDALGISCALLSGAVAQQKRLRVLDDFRAGTVRVLIATDVAGRGLHVDDVSHVVNFDLPYEAQDYVHRIGRTGRAGHAGTAVSFACEDESFVIPEIEKFIGRTLPCRVPEEALVVPLPPYKRKTPPRDGEERHGGRPGGGRGRSGPGRGPSGGRRPSSSRGGPRRPSAR
jgi:ATP-dependent RNA helicase RhlB